MSRFYERRCRCVAKPSVNPPVVQTRPTLTMQVGILASASTIGAIWRM